MLKKLSTAALIVLIGIGVMVLIISVTACSKPITKPTVNTTNKPEKESRFSGDHTTTQIRGLWYVCLQARQRSMPYILPPVHTAHCDCVIDKSREQFSSEDYDKLPQDNLSAAFTNINIECQIFNSHEPIKINPTSV